MSEMTRKTTIYYCGFTKDHQRDWDKFLSKQYYPEKYSVNVWWHPDE